MLFPQLAMSTNLCTSTTCESATGSSYPPVMSTAYFLVFLGALFVTLCESYDSFMAHERPNDQWRYNEYAFYVLLSGLALHTVRLYVSLHKSHERDFEADYLDGLSEWQRAIEWSIRMVMVGVVTLKLLAGYEIDSQRNFAKVLIGFFFVLLSWDVAMTSFLPWKEKRRRNGGKSAGDCWKRWMDYHLKYALRDLLGFLAALVLWWTAPVLTPHSVENDGGSMSLVVMQLAQLAQLLTAVSYTCAVLLSIGDDLDFLAEGKPRPARGNRPSASSSAGA